MKAKVKAKVRVRVRQGMAEAYLCVAVIDEAFAFTSAAYRFVGVRDRYNSVTV